MKKTIKKPNVSEKLKGNKNARKEPHEKKNTEYANLPIRLTPPEKKACYVKVADGKKLVPFIIGLMDVLYENNENYQQAAKDSGVDLTTWIKNVLDAKAMKLSTGGVIKKSDSVPVKIIDGDYQISDEASDKYGVDFLEAINNPLLKK